MWASRVPWRRGQRHAPSQRKSTFGRASTNTGAIVHANPNSICHHSGPGREVQLHICGATAPGLKRVHQSHTPSRTGHRTTVAVCKRCIRLESNCRYRTRRGRRAERPPRPKLTKSRSNLLHTRQPTFSAPRGRALSSSSLRRHRRCTRYVLASHNRRDCESSKTGLPSLSQPQHYTSHAATFQQRHA